VKVRSEKRQVCRTLKPAATLAAPKATPYVPTVTATLSASRTVWRRSSVTVVILAEPDGST
jgi:hypothetical protein